MCFYNVRLHWSAIAVILYAISASKIIMPAPLTVEARNFIVRLVLYFENERKHGGPVEPLDAVTKRVCIALNVSDRQVRKVMSIWKNGEGSRERAPKAKPVTNIDSFTITAIRNKVYEMITQGIHVTLESLSKKLTECDIFSGSITSLWKILRNIGFSWKKDDCRRAMYEYPHIVSKRLNFLNSFVREMRSKLPYQFVFLDETWVFQKGTGIRSWQDNDVRSVRRNVASDGKRYIVLHAGTRNGWVDGASWIRACKKNSGDYHNEMNQHTFAEWFEYCLLQKLEEPSCIIMDNAPYHSMKLETNPKKSWTKDRIMTWLTDHNITFDQTLFKRQLLDIAAKHAVPEKYVIDELAYKYGHKVLRLPPYHCIFNPIELVWGICKPEYNKIVTNNGGVYDEERTLASWEAALNKVTPEMWNNCIDHATKEIMEWYDREVQFDMGPANPVTFAANSDSEDDLDNLVLSESESESELLTDLRAS